MCGAGCAGAGCLTVSWYGIRSFTVCSVTLRRAITLTNYGGPNIKPGARTCGTPGRRLAKCGSGIRPTPLPSTWLASPRCPRTRPSPTTPPRCHLRIQSQGLGSGSRKPRSRPAITRVLPSLQTPTSPAFPSLQTPTSPAWRIRTRHTSRNPALPLLAPPPRDRPVRSRGVFDFARQGPALR